MLIDRESDGFSDRLGEFLHDLLIRRRDLHIYVLTWDFHMIYWSEREWWLPSNLAAHRRLHFVKDAAHPLGASHHQKVVVIDDALAFVGGLDFAQCRWDSPRHHASHPARMLQDKRPCRPFHDVQLMVNGPVAAALGELARDRWKHATKRAMPMLRATHHDDLWPCEGEADLSGVSVAIARTAPPFEGQPAVGEVEALFLDSLDRARRHCTSRRNISHPAQLLTASPNACKIRTDQKSCWCSIRTVMAGSNNIRWMCYEGVSSNGSVRRTGFIG